jgi:hypothetical protein
MNTSTDKTQTSPDLIGKVEAIGTILEQAEYTLDLLSGEYQADDGYPIFMVIDDLIVKAKQQNSELLRDLPKKHVPPVFPIIHDPLKDLVTGDIRTEAFELVAITKAIYLWAMNQRATACQLASCDLDSGDMVSLSDLARSKAQRIVELSNEFEGKVTSVGVQA